MPRERALEVIGIIETPFREPAGTPIQPSRAAAARGIVRIDSKGTTGLDVNAGAGGLGLEGDVTIIWNGKEAYKGPVKQVQLGDGARRRGFRR